MATVGQNCVFQALTGQGKIVADLRKELADAKTKADEAACYTEMTESARRQSEARRSLFADPDHRHATLKVPSH
jgi:hypothetical protein